MTGIFIPISSNFPKKNINRYKNNINDTDFIIAKNFINYVISDDFEEARNLLTSLFADDCEIENLKEFFNKDSEYKKINNFNNINNNISFIVMSNNINNANTNKRYCKDIINFYFLNEYDRISNRKIYKITSDKVI